MAPAEPTALSSFLDIVAAAIAKIVSDFSGKSFSPNLLAPQAVTFADYSADMGGPAVILKLDMS
ncbi:MAG: hypothetical protein QMD53_04760, partial [Actinomycetota bacterium]|nr:hypothetical protein [Actinomycetota bacterium]